MLTPNTPTKPALCRWDPDQCVEVTWTVPDRPRWKRLLFGRGEVIGVRDTKLDTASPVQWFTRSEWRRFLARDVWMRIPAPDRQYRLGDLAFSRKEWDAFLDGVAAGQFDLPGRRVAAVT